MEEFGIFEARGLNRQTGIPGSVFIGYFQGVPSDIREFLELTRPGFIEECDKGKSILRRMQVASVDQDALSEAYASKGRERPSK